MGLHRRRRAAEFTGSEARACMLGGSQGRPLVEFRVHAAPGRLARTRARTSTGCVDRVLELDLERTGRGDRDHRARPKVARCFECDQYNQATRTAFERLNTAGVQKLAELRNHAW